MIKIKDLSKSFGLKKVLNNINIELDSGKVYGVVGVNGAGKTTLFKCLSNLETFKGHIISDTGNLKNETGLLLTETYFFPKMTGHEFLHLMTRARHINYQNFKTKNIFNLPLNDYVSTYSTGMKKKLAFTGVLLQNNNFLILDEPFNGVDIQSNLIISEIILNLKQKGKTIIISSHIFSTLEETCDQIFLLENGEISKTVKKSEFKALEKEMKTQIIGEKITQLNL
ncbi:MAG: ATP-binding cassette domain-containing protein [Putridiphycobacter sp.]